MKVEVDDNFGGTDLYKCTKCETKFETEFELNLHISPNDFEQPYVCNICLKQYSAICDLDKHITEHMNNPFLCGICSKSWSDGVQLVEHMACHQMEEKVVCYDIFTLENGAEDQNATEFDPIQEFDDADNCSDNVASPTDEMDLNIKEEDEVGHTSQDVTKHSKEKRTEKKSKTTDERPATCQICSKTFSSKYYISMHMKIHEQIDKKLKVKQKSVYKRKKVPCKICGKERSDMSKHMRTHATKSFECYLCAEKFDLRKQLKRHMRFHTGLYLFECDACEMKTTDYREVKRHQTIHPPKQKDMLCDVCGKAFKNRSDLHKHKSSHKEKTFKCEKCPAVFTTGVYLRLHVRRVHLSEKRHFCPSCPFSAFQSVTLTNHMRTHTKGVKPYFCKVCSKRFSSTSSLKRHELVHTGERVKCGICDGTFACQKNLKRHMMVHTGEKPYGCMICSKLFRCNGNLKVHMKVHTK